MDGQLGIASTRNSLLPIKNEFYSNVNIKKIICGNRTSIVIDDKYQCYISGEKDVLFSLLKKSQYHNEMIDITSQILHSFIRIKRIPLPWNGFQWI